MSPPRSASRPPATGALRRLVEARLGLAFPGGLESAWDQGLERVQAALGGDPGDLLGRLEREPDGGPGWGRIAQELTIGESFFFRDPGQMALVRERLLPEWRARARAGAPVRLWSAGCSRGEEPYSLAILVAEAGGAWSGRVEILGTDVNPAGLDAARAAWFQPWSLRTLDAGARARWFLPEAGGFRLREDLRARVAFRAHNLVGGAGPGGRFDLILCRNVFIHLHPQAVTRALRTLRESLEPSGALVLGHGEWGTAIPEGLRLEAHPGSLLLRPALPLPVPGPAEPGPQARRPEPDLERLGALADAGRWREALEWGRALQAALPGEPRVHHLLALVLLERRADRAALARLDRALGVDPAYLPAHLDRARLLEGLGFRDRAAGAWADALRVLDGLPAGAPSGVEGPDRPALRDYLRAGAARCRPVSGGARP